jgi:transglutaminase/protease-like cytokinesis protein 3
MIRLIILIYFLVAVSTDTFSQTRYDSLRSLSRQITSGITTEREKLDAILFWVTDNIEYDVANYHRSLSGQNIYPDFGINEIDSIKREQAYDEAISCLTIFRKKAVCDGYARLFKSLCTHNGIQCVVVSGQAKTLLSDRLEGHAWNAVRLAGKWQLVDPTWASGYVNGDSFTKQRNLFYYLSSPEAMFINHLPDEQKWTLLDKNFNSKTFGQSPIEDVSVIEKGLTD